MRSVLHICIDSFFVEVERKRRPELTGKPVIVGRPKGSTSGVVVSASAEAKTVGVEEGMSVRQAKRACPDAVVLRADYACYEQFYGDLLDILAQFSPLLEPDSPGGAYIDVTASRALFGDPLQIANRIVSEVSDRLQIPISIGCASNKLLARLASATLSPRSQIRDPKSEVEFLAPLPVSALDAVTEKIEKRLRELGISTVGQLAGIPERLLIRQFGPAGSVLKRQSLGMDSSRVRAAYPPEVIIIEHMFPSALEEPAEVELYLRKMASEAELTLRKRCVLAGKVALKLRKEEGDSPFDTLHSPLKRPTDSAYTILRSLLKLLESGIKPGMQVTGVQVVLSQIERGEDFQLSLIGDGARRRRIEGVVEQIVGRFGERSIFFAASLAPTGRAGVLSRIAA